MAKYLDKSKEKWDELVDQWHSDSSLTCSLQEYLELDDIEYLKFAHGIDDPDISDTEVLEKSAGIAQDVVTELVIKFPSPSRGSYFSILSFTCLILTGFQSRIAAQNQIRLWNKLLSP
jgi:hypothetical protein